MHGQSDGTETGGRRSRKRLSYILRKPKADQLVPKDPREEIILVCCPRGLFAPPRFPAASRQVQRTSIDFLEKAPLGLVPMHNDLIPLCILSTCLLQHDWGCSIIAASTPVTSSTLVLITRDEAIQHVMSAKCFSPAPSLCHHHLASRRMKGRHFILSYPYPYSSASAAAGVLGPSGAQGLGLREAPTRSTTPQYPY